MPSSSIFATAFRQYDYWQDVGHQQEHPYRRTARRYPVMRHWAAKLISLRCGDGNEETAVAASLKPEKQAV